MFDNDFIFCLFAQEMTVFVNSEKNAVIPYTAFNMIILFYCKQYWEPKAQ